MTGTSFVYYIDADSSQWVQSAGDGGGGVNSLNDLDDVDIDPALLARDQGLLYDGTNWTVGSPPVLIEAANTTGLPILKATPVCVTVQRLLVSLKSVQHQVLTQLASQPSVWLIAILAQEKKATSWSVESFSKLTLQAMLTGMHYTSAQLLGY